MEAFLVQQRNEQQQGHSMLNMQLTTYMKTKRIRKSFSNLRMTNEVQIHLKIFIIIAPFGRNRVPELNENEYENEIE